MIQMNKIAQREIVWKKQKIIQKRTKRCVEERDNKRKKDKLRDNYEKLMVIYLHLTASKLQKRNKQMCLRQMYDCTRQSSFKNPQNFLT